MKLFKPIWVNHDDKPIFSLDVHPDGQKFATGGQGNDSGLVVIWNLFPVLSEEAEMDKTVPKILCQMDNHLACVNSVRWSLNGQMLASGGDDKIVMIWRKGKGSSGVFGSSGLTKTTESWRCVSTLRGHGGDVLDLAWSPQDRWLASCSVDNTIIIWDIHALPAMVAILKGHTGLVKGVTWDPVGKFIATQSDDRTVKIWKTSDWTCQRNITEPFDECGGTTHILRLSWSPDGQYLVSAHAMNGGGPTAQIIEREGWKCDKDFVGHRKAVTCVRFHNSILKRQAPKSNKSQQYCCLAVGSRDRSLSIWMTALQRPLLVIHELFQDSVLDLSWSTHGYILLACSGDGSVACLQFTAEELGTRLTDDDKNSLYQRMYGKSANIDMNVHTGKDMIIENSDLLNISTEKPKPPIFIGTNDQQFNNNNTAILNNHTVDTEKLSNTNNLQQPVTPAKPIHKQIETRTADGKRRITPMFIPLAQDAVEGTPEFSSSSRTTSNIIIENLETTKNDTKETEIFQIANKMNGNAKTNLEKIEKLQLDSRLTKAFNTAPAQTTLANTTNQSSTQNPQPQLKFEQIAVVTKPLALTGGKALPLKGSAIKASGDLRVQILNDNLTTAFGPLCKVCCFNMNSTDKKLWEIFIGSPIVNFSCCLKYVLLCSLDGTIRFLNIKTGISILPVINLPSAAVLCAFSLNSQLGAVLLECGFVRVWNVEEKTMYISTSCCDILKGGLPHMMSITENGVPFILLTNGCSYSYSKCLESWVVLNSRDPVVRHGFGGNTPTNIVRNMKKYPLWSFQTTSHIFKPAAVNHIDLTENAWQHTAKLTFIENQIELCKTINSPEEMKYWYSMLGYHLACNGTEKRVRLLLDELLGPSHSSINNNKKREILHIDKHILLGIVLKQLKSQTEWQRIYMEYSEQLTKINDKTNAKMDITE